MNKTTVCEKNKCIGCKGCMAVCGFDAITIEENYESFNAFIDKTRCRSCGECQRVCPTNSYECDYRFPIEWKQGWIDTSERYKSSSGGLAYALMNAFIESGGEVATCKFDDGSFVFDLFSEKEEIESHTGSKYVKSDTRDIFRDIRKKLLTGKRILFIGLPCQIASLKNTINNNLQENLYTVDLICHGAPTQKMFRNAMNDYGIDVSKVEDIQFRIKDSFSVIANRQYIAPKGVYDRYTLAFLNGLIYPEGCYDCRFARIERVSDITIGDSWGTEFSDEEQNGVSLVLCQTEKGRDLLRHTDTVLHDVDLNNAIASNQQLKAPSKKPEYYHRMMSELNEGKRFRQIIFKYLKRNCINQYIKYTLIKLHILDGGVMDNYQITFRINDRYRRDYGSNE